MVQNMNFQLFLPGIICIIVALVIMFRLMHYARFYAPSYFFWIGLILTVVGIISLIHPLAFLFVLNRTIAADVVFVGILICLVSLFSPAILYHSKTNNQKIDALLPVYTSNEFHEVCINAPIEKVKQVLTVTGVKDIPVARLLMIIRGIADEDVDLSDRASNNQVGAETISTPDFNFFVVSPDEWVTVMILKAVIITNDADKPATPEILTLEQFEAFNDPGYVKVAVNFRFIRKSDDQTILTTETRNNGITLKDSHVFGIYWRIIYPGSAIIRRVWLDTIKKKAQS